MPTMPTMPTVPAMPDDTKIFIFASPQAAATLALLLGALPACWDSTLITLYYFA